MITNVQECIKPISYIKTNAADMMNFVNDKKEPLIITQNGESFNSLKWMYELENKTCNRSFFNRGRYGGGAPVRRGRPQRSAAVGKAFPSFIINYAPRKNKLKKM